MYLVHCIEYNAYTTAHQIECMNTMQCIDKCIKYKSENVMQRIKFRAEHDSIFPSTRQLSMQVFLNDIIHFSMHIIKHISLIIYMQVSMETYALIW